MSYETDKIVGLVQRTVREMLRGYRPEARNLQGQLSGSVLPASGPNGDGYPPKHHTHPIADLVDLPPISETPQTEALVRALPNSTIADAWLSANIARVGGPAGPYNRPVLLPTGEALAAGSFVHALDDGGTIKVVRVSAADNDPGGAIGFVTESYGVGSTAEVYSVGSLTVSFVGGGTPVLNRLVFLSLTPGAVSLTAPSGDGILIQSLGIIAAIPEPGKITINVRYDFRHRHA